MAHYTVTSDGKRMEIILDENGKLLSPKKDVTLERKMSKGLVQIRIDNRYATAYCKQIGDVEYEVWIHHHIVHVQLEDEKSRLLKSFGKTFVNQADTLAIKAPMPGLVVSVNVEPGDIVDPGKGMLILEAMKMENEIRSPIRGKVKSISVTKGKAVEKGEVLLVIENDK